MNITASNTAGTATKSVALVVVPAAPVISSASTSNATLGVSYSHQIIATNSPIRYATTSLPSGLTINATTGLISGRPTLAGNHSLTISASNAGGTGVQSHTLRIAAP